MGLLEYFFLGVKLLVPTESALKCHLIELEFYLIWFQYNITFWTLLGNVQGLNLNLQIYVIINTELNVMPEFPSSLFFSFWTGYN